eukprot:GHVH01003273.1.p1 GENE.GHVH01003273.1~~GHVH01003273.1.p1  ORF type:complete len:583 (-),score=60.81 GHVH01003273.1:81-1829(-)
MSHGLSRHNARTMNYPLLQPSRSARPNCYNEQPRLVHQRTDDQLFTQRTNCEFCGDCRIGIAPIDVEARRITQRDTSRRRNSHRDMSRRRVSPPDTSTIPLPPRSVSTSLPVLDPLNQPTYWKDGVCHSRPFFPAGSNFANESIPLHNPFSHRANDFTAVVKPRGGPSSSSSPRRQVPPSSREESNSALLLELPKYGGKLTQQQRALSGALGELQRVLGLENVLPKRIMECIRSAELESRLSEAIESSNMLSTLCSSGDSGPRFHNTFSKVSKTNLHLLKHTRETVMMVLNHPFSVGYMPVRKLQSSLEECIKRFSSSTAYLNENLVANRDDLILIRLTVSCLEAVALLLGELCSGISAPFSPRVVTVAAPSERPYLTRVPAGGVMPPKPPTRKSSRGRRLEHHRISDFEASVHESRTHLKALRRYYQKCLFDQNGEGLGLVEDFEVKNDPVQEYLRQRELSDRRRVRLSLTYSEQPNYSDIVSTVEGLQDLIDTCQDIVVDMNEYAQVAPELWLDAERFLNSAISEAEDVFGRHERTGRLMDHHYANSSEELSGIPFVHHATPNPIRQPWHSARGQYIEHL